MKTIFKISSVSKLADKVTGIKLTPVAEEKDFRDEAGNESSIMITGKALESFPKQMEEKSYEITIKEIK